MSECVKCPLRSLFVDAVALLFICAGLRTAARPIKVSHQIRRIKMWTFKLEKSTVEPKAQLSNNCFFSVCSFCCYINCAIFSSTSFAVVLSPPVTYLCLEKNLIFLHTSTSRRAQNEKFLISFLSTFSFENVCNFVHISHYHS